MDDAPIGELRERVFALESEKARLELRVKVALAFAIVAPVMCVMQALAGLPRGVPAQVRTTALVAETLLLQKVGSKSQLSMGFNAAGLATIRMYNGDGKEALTLGIKQDNEPTVYFQDRSGAVRLSLSLRSISAGTSAIVDLSNPLGQNRMSLIVTPDGLPTINQRDGNGSDRMDLYITKEGDARIELIDSGKRQVIRLEVPEKGTPTIGKVVDPAKSK